METASFPRPDSFAHHESLRLPASAVVQKLVEIIGRKLTAYVGGVKDARAVDDGLLAATSTVIPRPVCDLLFNWRAL